jgi:hypothetical protein
LGKSSKRRIVESLKRQKGAAQGQIYRIDEPTILHFPDLDALCVALRPRQGRLAAAMSPITEIAEERL